MIFHKVQYTISIVFKQYKAQASAAWVTTFRYITTHKYLVLWSLNFNIMNDNSTSGITDELKFGIGEN